MNNAPDDAPDSFPGYWARTRRRIESELGHRVPKMFSAGSAPELDAVMRAVDGGKRIRGCLVCLTCNALGGRTAEALPRAVAVECIQAASLIHDDYVDGDRIRRDQPAGWIVDGSRRAVLVGDLIFATAIEQMAANGAVESALISFAIAAMARGAYLEQTDDLALAAAAQGGRYAYESERYDEIVRLKTAVLFAAAAKFGALAADASNGMQQSAFEFGLRLGKVYQLADDLAEAEALDKRADPASPNILSLAPVALRFSSRRRRGLAHLASGNMQAFTAWVRSETPSLRMEMTRAIDQCTREAVLPLAEFPDNEFTRMLHDMPAAIAQAAR